MSATLSVLLAQDLANLLDEDKEHLLVIDSRSFLEYNDSHVQGSVNIQSSKLIRKRLEQNKLSIIDLLQCSKTHENRCDKVILYDQNTTNISTVPAEHFIWLVVRKLYEQFSDVFYLRGGFAEFGNRFPRYCETKQETGNLRSISTPCMTGAHIPVTRVLPFLYLGSQEDSQDAETLKGFGIDFIMNVSASAADSPHVIKTHYMKIPVHDSTNENIVDWFQSAFDFIDQVQHCDGKVLVHCVGGVSRSATIAVGFVMRHLQLSLDNAYRLVKEKRPTISPNLNFMGQLLQYEHQLQEKGGIDLNCNRDSSTCM